MVRVERLVKTFRLTRKEAKKASQQNIMALNDVNLVAKQGEVLALLGSNGAGKTTTLRLLSTALEPDSGEIWINDIPVHQYPRRVRHRIGFLSNATALYRRLTVRENLQFFGRLYRIEANIIADRIHQVAQELNLEGFLDKKVDQLSTGMSQKASIARSILHNPDIIILDEPTSGLDVEASQQVLDFVIQQKRQGKTVIFSTHHMNEVEILADQICVINRGSSVFTGSIEQMTSMTGQHNLTQAFVDILKRPAA